MSKAIGKWLDMINIKSSALKDVLDLKRKWSCIDNLIAVEQTLLFLDLLENMGEIDSMTYDRIIANMDDPNAKGYDIYDFDGKIVAELKGTIPCKNGEKRFGGAQKKAILSDLRGLTESQYKTSENVDIAGFKKYMVLFDFAKPAMEDFLKSRTFKIKNKFVKEKIDSEEIKIVYIEEKSTITSAHCNTNFKF